MENIYEMICNQEGPPIINNNVPLDVDIYYSKDFIIFLLTEIFIEKGSIQVETNIIKMLLVHCIETKDLNTEAKVLYLFCKKSLIEGN